MAISGHRPTRLECKNPRRNAEVYHANRLGFSRDWIVKNSVFRCSRYVALPAIIPHGRGEGERFVYSRYGDVGHSVSQTINALESQTFSDIEVSAQMRSGIVCVNIYRAKNDSVQALTKNNAPSVIGKIKQKYRPSHNYVQYIGTKNGAWLLMSVNKKGDVVIYHQHVPDTLYWTYFEGSLSYPVA